MQDVLQWPIAIAVEHTVEHRRDDEQQRQRYAVHQGDDILGARFAAPQQLNGGKNGGQHPQAVRRHIGQMFDLGRERRMLMMGLCIKPLVYMPHSHRLARRPSLARPAGSSIVRDASDSRRVNRAAAPASCARTDATAVDRPPLLWRVW